MDFFETVNKRGSYRSRFKDIAIPDEDIRKILGAALKAPSGYNLQSTSFVVVTDEKLRKQIAELMPSEATETAPAIIVVVSERIEADGFCFEIVDYGAAAQTLWLAATAMGYATVWMDGDTNTDGNNDKIREMLNLPAGKTVRTIMPMGILEEEVVQNSRKPFEERVSYNRCE